MMKRLLLLPVLFSACLLRAQYAPQAMVAGSTAIAKSNAQFTAWASGCQVRRGLQQIDHPVHGYASVGDSADATGMPDGAVVSLGDSGVAILTFARPIQDKPGPDFAVFENGFLNEANPEEAFLELAFVEVSSDGIHYTRFPAASLTQDITQISSTGGLSYINARQLNNLAGKYIGSWGTPFDLSELSGMPGLDISAVTHVRLVDVIGAISGVGSSDAAGQKVNDPFPTPFPSSGFDLDAVGVLHAAPTSVMAGELFENLQLYPNPATDQLLINLPQRSGNTSVRLHDATGRVLQQYATSLRSLSLALGGLVPGAYYITIHTESGATCTRVFLHR